MKTIKVFVALSNELELERLEIADMIVHLNRILKHRGMEIELEPNDVERLEKFSDENKTNNSHSMILQSCEMCIVLYWNSLEDNVKEDLDSAYAKLCSGNNPKKVYVYFKDADDITPELKSFKESFATSYGHFFCQFENIDTMKLNFLLQFEAYQNTLSDSLLEVKESRVVIDGESFVELRNIPFAGNNPEYLHLLKQIESTSNRVLKYPDDADFRQELYDLEERRKAMEGSLLNTAKLITKLSSTVSSSRFAEAMRLFEKGDNKGANAILNLDEINRDAEANAARIETARELEADSIAALEANIDEYLLKINTLRNEMETGWVGKVIEVYEKAINVARNHISEGRFADLIVDYMSFLSESNQQHLAGTLFDEAILIYRNLAADKMEICEFKLAVTLNNHANFHKKTKRFDLAEEEYVEALEIYCRLAEGNPFECFDGHYITTLNNLADLHKETQRFDLAEEEFAEALKISRRLDNRFPQVYKCKVATILNSLASLHKETQRFDLAEEEYVEALEIRRRLAERDPDEFESKVAGTLNSLANFHKKTKRFDSAEEEYSEALRIYRRLAERYPDAYESKVATTLNNLASLHSDTQRFDLAGKEYSEALEIRRRLAERNPDAFESDVTNTLNNLANLHSDTQRFDLAEKEYSEALEIRRRLAERNPDAFESKVADVLNNLASLHLKAQSFDSAEEEYVEALEICRRLAERNPDAYENDVADTLNNLAVLHADIKRFDLAEEEYTESLKIYRRLAERNPSAYEKDVADTLNNLAVLQQNK